MRGLGRGSLRRRGGVWIGRWTDENGKEHRRALSDDRSLADRILAQIIRERDTALAGLARIDGSRAFVGEVWGRYIAHQKASGASAGHLRNLATAWRQFHGRFESVRVFALRAADVVDFRAGRVAAGASVRTANAQADALKAALRWAAETDLILVNPLAKLRALPESDATLRKVRRALSEDELARVLSASNRHDSARVFPLTPLWRFIAETGCRWKEAAFLEWSAVDLDAGVARIVGKRGRLRLVPFDVEIVRDLPRRGARVFYSADGRPLSTNHGSARLCLRRAMIAAGVARTNAAGEWDDPSLDVHALRTARATNLITAGVSPAIVASFLGNSPRVALAHYTKPRLEDVRAAVLSKKV